MDPRVYVDFNERYGEDEVLLSQGDSKMDSAGNIVEFTEGKFVSVFMDDPDETGAPDYLIADGVAMKNNYGGWTSAAKWILKIDERGIRRASQETNR